MTPKDELLHYNAVCELHHELSEWAHTADPPEFIVRRLLVDGNDITVDIVAPPTREIDRFVVSLGEEQLTAMAGALGVKREGRVWPRSSFRLEDLQSWFRATAGTCDLY
jgi:hypothetical protein